MITKKGEASVKGYATYSYVQLRKVENLINKLENANFVKKYFNKESINLLKECKKTIERSIRKEEELGTLKEESKFHSKVENIVKHNKKLEEEISAPSDIEYTSRRESNHGNQKKRGRGRPKKVLY